MCTKRSEKHFLRALEKLCKKTVAASSIPQCDGMNFVNLRLPGEQILGVLFREKEILRIYERIIENFGPSTYFDT